jgi:hypothetical protein
MNKHSLIIAKAEAKGSVLATKRFSASEKAEADAWVARWRKSGARTTVTVVSPPPPPRVNPDLNGPDAPWGGFLTIEANEALDLLDA